MKAKLVITAAVAGLLACGSAFAGDYSTALGKCLYKNSTDADKTTLTQWAFVTIGKTDAAKSITTIPSAKSQEVTQQAKSVVTRLITSSCSSEAKQVVLKEPTTGINGAIASITAEMLKDKLASSAKGTFSNSLISSDKAGQVSETATNIKNASQGVKGLLGK